MREAICGLVMSNSWLNEQMKHVVEASYRDKEHPGEAPTDCIYRKLELLNMVGNYTYRELKFSSISVSSDQYIEDLQSTIRGCQRKEGYQSVASTN
jgi:hypothetical protein